MDVAYNQHASQARRKNRSTTNLNHLSLAPLTSKLPLNDEDAFEGVTTPPQRTLSYLQGKSAPTTPALLSRSPARSQSRPSRSPAPFTSLPKSKSASHLASSNTRKSISGAASPKVRRRKDEPLSAKDGSDSDWLLRTGALISSETREFKGQAWLVSRASSTSLTGMHDDEEEDKTFERETVRIREISSRKGSRRGSLANLEDDHSSLGSHKASRSHSRAGSRTQLFHPPERYDDDSYFPQGIEHGEYVAGPDFVNLDERLEAIQVDTSYEDEATIRRLVKRGNGGVETWVGNLIGWSLFSVEENEEESDDEDGTTEEESEELQERCKSVRHFEGVSNVPEERIPPPNANEGGWQDAAWLLSVASKVLL
jgi:hypothetical protein